MGDTKIAPAIRILINLFFIELPSFSVHISLDHVGDIMKGKMSTVVKEKSIEQPEHASVVVLGGGAMGCSTVYHLAKMGITDVVLLERNKISSGTTWHSAAQVRALRSTRNLTELIKYSIKLYSGLESETGQSVGWINRGSLSIATNKDRLTHIRKQESLADLFGVEVCYMSGNKAKDVWPLMNSTDVIGAVFSAQDGRVSPSDLCTALIKSAKRHGAKIFEHSPVLKILTKFGKIYGVETNEGLIRTEKIVICAGLWSKKIAKTVSVDIPVWPCEHFYLLTAGLEAVKENLPTLSDHDSHLYIRDDSGGILVGCFEPLGKALDPDRLGDDFSFQLLPEDWEHFEPMMENAIHRIPLLKEAPVKMLLNGPESFTPDGNFLLGETSEVEGLYIGAGMNSVGIASAGGAGMALARTIVEGTPPFDLNELDPKRFDPIFSNIKALSARVPEVLGKHYEITYPGRQWNSARDLKCMRLHNQWKSMNAHFGQVSSYERPLFFNKKGEIKLSFDRPSWFEQVREEVNHAKTGLGVVDLSSFGKIDIIGNDAIPFLKKICTARLDRPDGSVIYSLILNSRGGIECDLIIFRLSSQHFRLQISASCHVKIKTLLMRYIRQEFAVTLRDISDSYSVLGLMGPQTIRLAEELKGCNWINNLNYFRFSSGVIEDVEVIVARLSFVGEAGWEVTCRSEDIEKLYLKFKDYGAKPVGLFAQNSMRIEKMFLSYGHDMDSDTKPDMVGLGKIVPANNECMRKEVSYFEVEQPETSERLLVSLLFEDDKTNPDGNEPVMANGKIIGMTTSAAYGHRIKKPIALAMMQKRFCWNGNIVQVKLAGSITQATIVRQAAYDPLGLRMKEFTQNSWKC